MTVVEKRIKMVIYDTLNDDRIFDMYQIIFDFGCIVKYDVVDMSL